MRRFWDTLCCLNQENNDGVTVLHGSVCASQVHKGEVEDCLTLQAPCTFLSLETHKERDWVQFLAHTGLWCGHLPARSSA